MEPYWITILTVVGGLAYIFFFFILLKLLVWMTVSFSRSGVLVRLLLLVPLVVLGIVFILMDFVHTLLCIWLGARAMSGVREWWNRTN
jgi:hypothetical protein